MQYSGPDLYSPESFEQAARDLAHGCSSLEMIRMHARMSSRDATTDLACRVVRDGESGTVKNIDMPKNGGMTIGREELW